MTDHAAAETNPATQLLVVPHIHADLCWPDIPDVCINACVEAIGDTLRYLQQAPDFRFTMEHMFYLRTYLSRHPEHQEVIRDLISRQIFECGAMYLGSTEVTTGPEGLVRCLLMGAGWLKQQLGIEAHIAWNVDCPGHTLQLPQLLAKAGVRHFVLWKTFSYYERDFSGYSGPWLFRWRAPDGSEVTVAFTPGGYHVAGFLGLREDLDTIRQRLPLFLAEVNEHFQKYNLPPVIILADGGDIQRPSLQVLENIRAWNESGQSPPLAMASTSEFFARLEEQALPVTQGEMPCWWDTMQGHEQQMVMTDRRCEARLLAAESLGTFVQKIDASFEYPRSNIETAWQNRLFATEHNWDGRNGEVSDALLLNKVQSAQVLARNSLDQALFHLCAQLDYAQEGFRVVVYNPLAWPRTDVAAVSLKFRKGQVFALSGIDQAGQALPLQVTRLATYHDASIREVELLLQVSLGPYGYTTCYLQPGPAWPAPGDYTVTQSGERTFENDYFRLVVDAQSGGLVSLWDKGLARELLNPAKFHGGEFIAFEETGIDETEYLTGRCWLGREFPARVRLVENGPVRAVITAEGDFVGGAQRQLSFILYRRLARLEVQAGLDWQGQAERRINLLFPFAQSAEAQLTYEVPFGWVRYGQENPYHAKIHPSIRFARNWLNLSNGDHNLTLATEVIPNDLCDRTATPMPGFVIQPILLRTVFSCYEYIDHVRQHGLVDERFHLGPAVSQFDLRPEQPQTYFRQPGRHDFRFGLSAQAGPFNPVRAARSGLEHNTPLVAFVWEADQLGHLSHLDRGQALRKMKDASRALPATGSFLQVTSPRSPGESLPVVVTAVKPAEHGQGVIVRLFNPTGQPVDTVLSSTWPVSQAWLTNLLEEDQTELAVTAGACRLAVGAYAIETIRLLLS
jgi:alpha-mannosidase